MASEYLKIDGKEFRYFTFFNDETRANHWIRWKRGQGTLVRKRRGNNRKGKTVYRIYVYQK